MKTIEEVIAEIDRRIFNVKDVLYDQLGQIVSEELINLRRFILSEPAKCEHHFVIGKEGNSVVTKCQTCGEIRSKWP